MKASGLTSVLPRHIFVPLNWYVPKNLAQICHNKVCKKTLRLGWKCILSQSTYFKF